MLGDILWILAHGLTGGSKYLLCTALTVPAHLFPHLRDKGFKGYASNCTDYRPGRTTNADTGGRARADCQCPLAAALPILTLGVCLASIHMIPPLWRQTSRTEAAHQKRF